jgi:hypothetical protein
MVFAELLALATVIRLDAAHQFRFILNAVYQQNSDAFE